LTLFLQLQGQLSACLAWFTLHFACNEPFVLVSKLLWPPLALTIGHCAPVFLNFMMLYLTVDGFKSRSWAIFMDDKPLRDFSYDLLSNWSTQFFASAPDPLTMKSEIMCDALPCSQGEGLNQFQLWHSMWVVAEHPLCVMSASRAVEWITEALDSTLLPADKYFCGHQIWHQWVQGISTTLKWVVAGSSCMEW
jgi:hypothetical protein